MSITEAINNMLVVRPATVNDLAEILAIYNEVILHTTAVFEYRAHTMDMRKNWFETKAAQGFPVFVAEEHGTVLGLSTLGPFRPWAAYKYTVENSVYVKSDQRGRGIGGLLMKPLIASARSLGMHAIVASIEASNTASLHLHHRFGFEEVAHFRQVGYKFGKWLDLKFLELLLDTPGLPVEG